MKKSKSCYGANYISLHLLNDIHYVAIPNLFSKACHATLRLAILSVDVPQFLTL